MGAWGKATVCFSHGLFQYYSKPWKVQVPFSLFVSLKYSFAAAAGAFPWSLYTQESQPLLPRARACIYFWVWPLWFDSWWQKNGLIRVKISSAACGLGFGVTAFIKMLWLKTSYKMHVYVYTCIYIYVYTMHVHTPTYKCTFMPADTFVVEMQAVELQIRENGKMLPGSSVNATLF